MIETYINHRSKRLLFFVIIFLGVINQYLFIIFKIHIRSNYGYNDDDIEIRSVQNIENVDVDVSASPRVIGGSSNVLNLISSAEIDIIPDEKKIPSVIIAGTQKGGTEAIQTYLNSFPQMVQSKKYEAHFFDKFMPFMDRDLDDLTAHEIELVRQRYIVSNFKTPLAKAKKRYDVQKNGIIDSTMTLMTFEKTALYIFDPNVPQRIFTICPWSKIIMLLRDPIERAYSEFKMVKQKKEKKRKSMMSFESVIEDDIEVLKQYGILADDIFSISANERRIRWLQYFNSIEDIRGKSFIGRGLYYMQLEIWLDHYRDEKSRKKLLFIKSEDIRPNPTTKEVDLKPITDFIGLPDITIKANETIHSTKDVGEMNIATRIKLQELFEPFNKKLFEILGKEWENVWSYNGTT